MPHPPSLPQSVADRSFRARNGELGLTREDALTYLAACATDGIEVLGWELWLIDHNWGFSGEPAEFMPGVWTGAIPRHDAPGTSIFGGTGDLACTRREIAEFDIEGSVAHSARPYVRFCVVARTKNSRPPRPTTGVSGRVCRTLASIARLVTGSTPPRK